MKWKQVEAILKRPFDDHEINWMPKSTSKDGSKVQLLAYMDARGVRDRLDEAFGPDWKTTYKPGPQGGVVCSLSIKWEGEWRAREGGADNTQIEAVKGGLSDAEKRAATEWGIGRHLYDLGATWVKLQDKADYSVAEGRRIYTKGKHAVAPSIRKMQPELFNKPKAAPKPKEQAKDLPHDKQWERDRKYFMVRLKELNFAYEVVVYMLQVMDKPRPSQMPAPKRTALLDWLADLSPQTRERWEEDYAVNVLGAPSKGDTNV